MPANQLPVLSAATVPAPCAQPTSSGSSSWLRTSTPARAQQRTAARTTALRSPPTLGAVGGHEGEGPENSPVGAVRGQAAGEAVAPESGACGWAPRTSCCFQIGEDSRGHLVKSADVWSQTAPASPLSDVSCPSTSPSEPHLVNGTVTASTSQGGLRNKRGGFMEPSGAWG